MATWEPVDVDHDEIDFEDEYDKVNTIDEVNLDESMTALNKLIREQEELLYAFHRGEWTSMNEGGRRELEQQIAFNKKEQELCIMRASKTILSILHRGSNKIKQGGRVMVLDEKAAEKLYNRLRLEKSDRGTYKIAFHTEKGMSKDVLSPGNKWLTPDAYLKIFGRNLLRISVLTWINLKAEQKVRFQRRENNR